LYCMIYANICIYSSDVTDIDQC